MGKVGSATAQAKYQLTLSHGVLVKGELVSMKVMMMSENQSS
jgi:hypothetical protein